MEKKNRIYLTILCLVLAGVCVIGVYGWYSNSRLDRSLKITPERVQREIVEELKRRGIPHKVNEQGFISYHNRSESVVREVENEIKKKHFPALPNISFSDVESKRFFLSLLEENQIPYVTKKLDAKGNEYVLWEEKFDSKVQALIANMNEKLGMTKRPLRLSYPDDIEREILTTLMKEENIPFRLIRNDRTECEDIEFDWKYDSRVGKLLERVQEIKRGNRHIRNKSK